MFFVNRNSDLDIGENVGMNIGQRIREARKAAGMTQGQLASKVGLKQNSISELEKGDSASTTHMAKFAQALRVSALWLETGAGRRAVTEGDQIDGGATVDDITAQLESMIKLNLISQREARLLRRYRMASEDAKDKIETYADLSERDQLFIVHDQAKS